MANPNLPIPVENLTRQYQQIGKEVEEAILSVLPTGKYVLGPNVKAFEEEFAAYCQTKYALGISSGTEALHLALLACGIGEGDEVITVPNTYIATVFAISYAGAKPVFVDVDERTFNLDISQLESKITEKTKAIIPLHLYGQPAEMDAVMNIAAKYHLAVVEDDAHAHGATYKGKRVGSFGNVGCFSFYPTKVLGAFGDGGAVTLNDDDLYDRLKMLRYMGQHRKYYHEIIGYQQRLDEIQAAILRVKLRYLDRWIDRRIELAQQYTELLSDLPLKTPLVMEGVRHVFYVYSILTPHRDQLMSYLEEHGIGSMAMYPLAVPYQPAYQYLGHKPGDFPVTDAHMEEILCLPMFPELTDDEVKKVSDVIHTFFRSQRL